VRSGLLSFFSALGSFGRQLAALPRPKSLPFVGVVRSMDGPTFKADLVAGLNVALLAFPMSMAFAMKAGLPIWCGLVGCGVAAVVAPLFSGSANLSAGPTNATAALLLGSFAALSATNPELRASALPTLVLLTGLFLLLASWLRLSGFADFVPRTVIAAYIAAAALRVIARLVRERDAARDAYEARACSRSAADAHRLAPTSSSSSPWPRKSTQPPSQNEAARRRAECSSRRISIAKGVDGPAPRPLSVTRSQ
jgi:hypothetical protein